MEEIRNTLKSLDTILKDPNESRHHKRIALAQKRAYKHAISEFDKTTRKVTRDSIMSLFSSSDEEILPLLTLAIEIYTEKYLEKHLFTPYSERQVARYVAKQFNSIIPTIVNTYPQSEQFEEDEKYNYEHQYDF